MLRITPKKPRKRSNNWGRFLQHENDYLLYCPTGKQTVHVRKSEKRYQTIEQKVN